MKEFNPVCSNISINRAGELCFAAQSCVKLAEEYGTPLYLMDEDRIRHNCRLYTESFQQLFLPGSMPLYGSKACSFKQMYRIMADEGMGVDLVSCGEIFTAKEAGFDLKNGFFHGNNKTDEDIAFAMDMGVGCFVADNIEELYAIESAAEKRGTVQDVLLRITPGIDPHTYAAVSTGKIDSKFGAAIETGQAEKITLLALQQKHIRLLGYHCHVGSQVFAEDVFERAAEIMLTFAADIKVKAAYSPEYLNLGGGYGVRYLESDPQINIPQKLAILSKTIKRCCKELALEEPKILMEPGRSIAADAGMTLYTVGSLKRIPGYRNYVSVDGGMYDNPRVALYGAAYTVYAANKMSEDCSLKADLVGRCCESGDVLQRNVLFPESIKRGDIIAVCTTGAYHYSMASNYNRLCRPAVIMLSRDSTYIAVKRESFEDLVKLDI